jgi:sugar lactone lactonase YvrE
VRYDPDRKVEPRMAVPAKQSSSLAFGGPDLTSLFVTTAGFSDALPLAPPGYDAQQGYIGGNLFLAESGIVGKPEFRCRIQPKLI